MACIADVDWAAIAEKLPYERTPEAFAKRSELFDSMDPNGNGYLSLAEVDRGIQDVLRLEEVFNAKPAILRAFQAAKNYIPTDAGTPGEDYVQRREFRIFLEFLRHYFELWVMFEGIDSEMDRRLNLDEFTAALPSLASWGVLIEEEKAPEVFGEIDVNNGGQVLFAEFCEWAIRQRLDLGEEKGDGDCIQLSQTVEERCMGIFQNFDADGSGTITKEELFAVLSSLNNQVKEAELDQIMGIADLNKDGAVDYKEFINWVFKKKGGREGAATKATREMAETQAIDWDDINSKLPFERTPEAQAKRTEMFEGFDPNGNGYLSLAEVDKGIRDILGIDEIFDAKPAIMRAFQAAKNAIPAAPDSPGEDYVQRTEFRVLLQYLRHYFELWVMFSAVDTSNDRRIGLDEFTAAVPKLGDWGVAIEDPEAVFGQVDGNDGGQVLFGEFCTWAISQKLDLGEEDE